MENGSIIAVATAVLSIISVFLGTKYKNWLERVVSSQTFFMIVAAAEDDKVTEEKFKDIVTEAKKVALCLLRNDVMYLVGE